MREVTKRECVPHTNTEQLIMNSHIHIPRARKHPDAARIVISMYGEQESIIHLAEIILFSISIISISV